MKHLNFSIILFLILITACNRKHTYNHALVAVDSLKFDLGYDCLPKYTGTYYDSVLQQEVIYFGDVNTKHTIKFFSTDAVLIDSVPIIPEVYLFLPNIDWIQVRNIDTILLSNNYESKITAINRKGVILKEIDLGGKLIDSMGNNVMLGTNYERFKPSLERNVIYPIGTWIKNRDQYYDSDRKLRSEKKEAFYNKYREAAQAVEIINLFSDTPHFRFLFYNFYNQLFPQSGTFPFELHYFTNEYIYSNYKNMIYKHDFNTLVDSFIVNPDHTVIDFKPYNVNNSKYEDHAVFNQIEPRLRGLIAGANHDKNYIYINVFHSLKKQDPNRPYSLLIFDRKHNKIVDKSMEVNYRADYTMVTSKGLMINFFDENNINPKEKKYKVYNVK